MAIRERIGIDIGTDLTIVEGVKWATENGVQYVDVCLDGGSIDPGSYSANDAELIGEICEENYINLGLHTLSAVNVAETSPHVSEAVDKYLRSYVDIGKRVGAERLIVHGGYHFTDDSEERTEAAIKRLKRILEYAEGSGISLFLENHNQEPVDSEMHYMPATLDACEHFFAELQDDNLGWAFNPPHARLSPEEIDGYLGRLGVNRCGQVRLNDNDGEVEEHLPPGEGTVDFEKLFHLLEDSGYRGHYMVKFGTINDMLEGREYLVDQYSKSAP